MNDEDDRGHQKDVSAEPARAQTPPRIPSPHGDKERPEGAQPPPGQGPQAPLGLKNANLNRAPVRLRKRPEFQYVQKGERKGRPTLAAQARRRPALTNGRPDAGPPRVGFTCTKKIGNAVVRNRARRRLREAARQLVPLHGLSGVDYVFLAREATADAPWHALLDDMKDALLRLAAALERKA
jgi:ribonuclease P protein component